MNPTTYSGENVLFIGNGINNQTNSKSWEQLLKNLRKAVGKREDEKDLQKEFPLVFENLLVYGKRNKNINESELKKIIANQAKLIEPNALHDRIRKLNPKIIITTNYDHALEKALSTDVHKNSSLIKETKYSVFRVNKVAGTKIWHAHGDIDYEQSINLGFEHYSGQLQVLRNYLVTGTNYESNKVPKLPFAKRHQNNDIGYHSWVDYIFTKNIHIIGLRMDFIEIDLWWLITYRAKLKLLKERDINNEIFYYIPDEYVPSARGKIDLFQNMGVRVKAVDKTKFDYYNRIFDSIEGKVEIPDFNINSNKDRSRLLLI